MLVCDLLDRLIELRLVTREGAASGQLARREVSEGPQRIRHSRALGWVLLFERLNEVFKHDGQLAFMLPPSACRHDVLLGAEAPIRSAVWMWNNAPDPSANYGG
jgi:hypothetical protein